MEIGKLEIKGKIDFEPLKNRNFSAGDWVIKGDSQKAGKVFSVGIKTLTVVFTHLSNRKMTLPISQMNKAKRVFKLFIYWNQELKIKL